MTNNDNLLNAAANTGLLADNTGLPAAGTGFPAVNTGLLADDTGVAASGTPTNGRNVESAPTNIENGTPPPPPQDNTRTQDDPTLGNSNFRSIPVQQAALMPEHLLQFVSQPNFAELMQQLNAYAVNSVPPATIAGASPPYVRRNLFQVGSNTEVTPRQILEELATTRLREAELQKTVKEMRSTMHRAISSAPDIDRVLEETQQTPFTRRISNADMRHVGKLKMPNYDGVTAGKTDPISHLTAFTIAAGRARLRPEERDPILCQLFVENLSGAALQWFSKLKPGTIDSFNDLSQAFMKQYSILVRTEESAADLYKIIQSKGESLRKYIDRFKSVASRVAIDDTASIEALRNGLWYDSRFKDTLSSSRPTTLEDALHRASVYIKIDEEREILHKQHAPKVPPKEKPRDSYNEPRQHYDGRQDDRGKRPEATYQISDQTDQPWNVYVRKDGKSQPNSDQSGRP